LEDWLLLLEALELLLLELLEETDADELLEAEE
jgi:hypothetical protein